MQFVDTHAHIHFKNYPLDPDETWFDAKDAGVTHMLAVGCDAESSENAVNLAQKHDGIYAIIGIHPHEAGKYLAEGGDLSELRELLEDVAGNKIVGIGEFGLDYFYEHSSRDDQVKLLRAHLELVQESNLPAVFHIRDAFDDFWPVFDEFHAKKPIKGVVHCFSAHTPELSQALSRGLYVALNGIMTFTSDEKQLEAARLLPLDKMLLETDAPYLTPKPLRGKICKPEHVVLTAEFLAGLRGESIEQIANVSSKNAFELFNL